MPRTCLPPASLLGRGERGGGPLLAVPIARRRSRSDWTPYATYAMGYLDYWSGDTANAISELETVVRLLKGIESPYTAHSLIYLAGLLDDLDRGAEALDYVGRAIGAAQPFSTDLQVTAAMGMGSVLSERGAPEACALRGRRDRVVQSRRFARAVGRRDADRSDGVLPGGRA